MAKILLLLRTVKYLKLLQVFFRIYYLLKRYLLSISIKLMPFLFSSCPSQAEVSVKSNLRLPIFYNTEDYLRQTEEGWVFNFLNNQHKTQLDQLWKPILDKPRLWNMTLHYCEWMHHMDNDSFVSIVSQWIKENRPYSQNSWYASWNSYAISLRCVSWIKEYDRRKLELDEEFLNCFKNSIFEQLVFLNKNLELDLGGNHLIKNIKALLWGINFFEGSYINKLQIKVESLLTRELEIQVLNDGFHYELSPSYHLQVFEDLLECYTLLPKSDVKLKLKKILENMALVADAITFPDGGVSLFGDSGLSMSRKTSDIFEVYEKVIGNIPISNKPIYLKDSGYFIFRDEYIDLIYDAGKIGPDELTAHSHGDIFSFELCVEGHRVFVDKGVFEYKEGVLRDQSRSSESHNTLSLDGNGQAEFWSSFRTGRRPNVSINQHVINNSILEVDAQHDGFSYLKGNPIHRRIFKFDNNKKIIHISDFVKSNNCHKVISGLLLHPQVKIIKKEDNSLEMKIGNWKINVVSKNLNIILKDEKWWPNLGVEYPCKKILFSYPSNTLNSDIYIELLREKQ